jgi:uncharacterized protein YnzC (UPF0291/DUF896 family)
MTSKSGSTPEALREIAAAITELSAKAKQRKLHSEGFVELGQCRAFYLREYAGVQSLSAWAMA